MNNYFSEIVFKKHNDEFWFPFFFDAKDPKHAERKLQTYITAINKHYDITNNPNYQLVIDGINSDRLKEYVDNRLKGKVCVLNTNIWEINGMEAIPELNLFENMTLLKNTGDYNANRIAEMVNKLKLPVKKVSNEFPNSGEEFLLINVLR